jgi:hypothetical protein
MAQSTTGQPLMPGTPASEASAPQAPAKSESDANALSSSDARQPITNTERIGWVVNTTVGPAGLAGELLGAGWDTLLNSPPKGYGTHWQGYGDRVGMSVAGNAVSNTIEAGLGAAWGEDPRYFRDGGGSFGHRLGHAAKMTFMAEDHNGGVMPAYARFIAIPGGNFLSNAWRASGDNDVNRAGIRTGIGFLGRFGSNVFDEFWPDFKQKLFRRGAEQSHN